MLFKITSDPFLKSNEDKANKFADEPELTVNTCFTPRNLERCRSNDLLYLPAVSHPSNDASTIATNSSSPINFPEGGTADLPG